MWYTPEGMRVLQGAEARLFQIGVVALARRAYADGHSGYFGRLTGGERLLALSVVARSLLDPKQSFRGHAAWSEATIHAIYRLLQCGASRSRRLQQLIWIVCRQTGVLQDIDPPVDETDPEEAVFAVECLTGRVLWDRDWEMAEDLCDVDGEDEYFTDPPKVTPPRLAEAESYLRSLELHPAPRPRAA